MDYKLVVFVPREALDRVRDAVFAAGAGRIGDYERCSWYTEGTGTFLGGEGTEPAIGEPGREEQVPEFRLETILPAEREGGFPSIYSPMACSTMPRATSMKSRFGLERFGIAP